MGKAREGSRAALQRRRCSTQGANTRSVRPTGDRYIDDGALCDGKTGNACFLTDKQRARLIGQFQHRVGKASASYLSAVESLHVETLMQKADTEVHWIVSMLLDIVVGFVTSRVSSSVLSLRNASKTTSLGKRNDVNVFDDLEQLDVSSFAQQSLKEDARSAFANLKDEAIKSRVKQAVEGLKKSGLAARSANVSAAHANNKTASLGYLDQLKDSSMLGFTKLGERTPANAVDAELVAMFHAMAPEHHLPSQYKTAIAAKLDRFLSSGVAKVGPHYARRGITPIEGEDIHAPRGSARDVIRHTRVAWREYVSGYPRDLVFEHMDGERDPNVIAPGDPGFPGQASAPRAFGPRRRITKEAERGSLVPREFHEAALLRHQSIWSEAPQTTLVDDSLYWWDADRVEQAQKAKHSKGVMIDAATNAHRRATAPKSADAANAPVTAVWQDLQDVF